jgi:hypothetical protein
MIYASKILEVAGGWRKLHIEELYNLCSVPNIIRVILSRRMRWVRHGEHAKLMHFSWEI